MCVEIRVYPNKLVKTEYEPNEGITGISIEQWLIENVAKYERLEVPLYSMELNEKRVPHTQWDETQLCEGDLLEIYLEPKEPMTIAMVVIAVVSAAAAIYYANQIPDNYNTTTPNGSSVYDANVQGNKVRLMGVVPEHFGLHINYPDILTKSRRVYENDESWKYLFLCVGKGEYENDPAEMYIGNTPIDRYVTDIEHQLFAPGADVSGHEAHRNFYGSPEVDEGGLEVSAPLNKFIAEEGSGRHIEVAPLTSHMKTIVLHDGGDNAFPWPAGSQIQLNGIDYDTEIFNGVVDVEDMGEGFADRITAAFGLNVAAVGAEIQLLGAGDDDSTYFIKAIDATYIELKDAQGAIVKLSAATRILISILKADDVLGLYDVDEVNSNFANLSRVGDPSWVGFTSNKKYNSISATLIDGSVTPEAIGPFVASPAKQTTNLIQLDFMFDGLGRLNDDGSTDAHSIEIEIRYRELNTSNWVDERHIFMASTRDQFGRSITISLPKKMEVEVEVERISHEEDDIRLSDKIKWTALRCELDTVTSYPGMTTLALKIRGTNALASTAENKVNLFATRKLLTFDGNGDLTQFSATKDIAPAMYYVAISAGYSPEQIDLVELYRLHLIWVARGDEFNAIFDNEITVWEALKRVLAVGFAVPTLDFGQIIPVRDEKRETLNFMYQADNMIKNSWKMDATLFDESEPDGVEVEYFSLETRKPETIECLLPGDAGQNLKKVRPFGITSRDKAYQYGMRKRSELKYRRIQHKWSTEMDGLNSNHLSYDALGIDIPGFSQTGRVEDVVVGVNDTTVKVNQDLTWGAGAHYIGLRNPEGKMSGPYVCTQGVKVDEVVITDALDFVPALNGQQEPPLFMFGVAKEFCMEVLVKDIKPQGTDRVSLTAVNYDERVFDYDDAVAPI